MDEAATPFPRLEHTPPDTKINLFMPMRLSFVRGVVHYTAKEGKGRREGRKQMLVT
jgi:hypothetical protein